MGQYQYQIKKDWKKCISPQKIVCTVDGSDFEKPKKSRISVAGELN